MKKVIIFALTALGLVLASCQNSKLDPLSGIYPAPTVVKFTKVDNSEAFKEDNRWNFVLDLSDASSNTMHAVLIGNKYYLGSNSYTEAPESSAKNGNFIAGITTVNGKRVRQGTITIRENGTKYSLSGVLFAEDGTPFKVEWEGDLVYEEPAVLDPQYTYTDAVAMDCTDADNNLYENVESHTLTLKNLEGEFAAQIKLIRATGTPTSALAGTYTVAEYAHEDFQAGNGFDLGVYFGMDAGAYVIGSYYVEDGTVVIIEPGAKISVTDMGEGVYTIEGDGFSFLCAPEGFVPGGGTVYDMEDTVAVDCTDADNNLYEDVESHTLVMKDGAGTFVAQMKLIRAVGTTDLSGTYTVAEYAHEDFQAGNGFDLGVYFGMDPGAYVIGSYYVADGEIVIVEPGETIEVSKIAEDTYKFVGSTDYEFPGKLKAGETPGPGPGPGPADDEVYTITEELADAVDETYAPVAGVKTHYLTLANSKGEDMAWFQLVLNEGVTDLTGEYVCKEYAHEDHTFGNGYDLSMWGMGVGGSRYVGADGKTVLVNAGETLTITKEADGSYKFAGSTGYTIKGKLEGGEPGPGPEPGQTVELTEFLSLTDYGMYGMKMVGMELGTPGFSYQAPDYQTTWTPTYSVDGNFLKLELYSEDGKVAPGTYVPSAANGTVNPGEFNLGAESWGGAGGTAWYTVANGAATFALVTDGTVDVALDGDVYTIEIKSTAVNAKYVGKLSSGSGPVAEGIVIDGDMSDWDAIEGVSDGNYGMFKAASDDEYLYFYSWRNTGGRYSDIWGEKSGYIYLGFDLDGDETNGESLWGNGPYDFVGVIYPYAGTASAPAFSEAPGDACVPDTYTLANVFCKGYADEDGAYVEYRIPRADLPTIPNTPITIKSWGNKDLTKVTLVCTL